MIGTSVMKELTILDSFISFRKKRGFEISNVILQWLNNVSLNGFRKTNNFYPLKHTRICAYQGVILVFWKPLNIWQKAQPLRSPHIFWGARNWRETYFERDHFSLEIFYGRLTKKFFHKSNHQTNTCSKLSIKNARKENKKQKEGGGKQGNRDEAEGISLTKNSSFLNISTLLH